MVGSTKLRTGHFWRDLGKTALNYAVSPLEAIAGKNFYDPYMEGKAFKGIQKAQDAIGSFNSQLMPTVANMIVPGSGLAIQGARMGIGMADPKGYMKDFGQEYSQANMNSKQNLGAQARGLGYNPTQNMGNNDGLAQAFGLAGSVANAGLNMFQPSIGLPQKGLGGFSHPGTEYDSEDPNFGNYPRFMLEQGGMPQVTGPTYEAENNEVVQGPPPKMYGKGAIKKLSDGMYKIKGKTHTKGGEPMSGGQYVYSDKLTIDDSFLNDI